MQWSNLIKKVIVFSLVVSIPLSVAASVSAQSQKNELKQTVRNTKKELRQTVKDQRMELKASASAARKNRAIVVNADLTAMNGTTLTVTKKGKTYTVTTSAETKFRRHFGGASSLSEFSVGNKLDVRGQWTDQAKTTIAAQLIHNHSIMKRRGTFVGEILSINDSTFILKSVNRGNQTVTVNSSTKYVNRKMEVITLKDVAVGHRVRVKGMWDKSNNTITQVTQLKDYSLPPKASPSATQ